MLKVVVDTNIWIRALLGGRLTSPVLAAWRQGKFEAIWSEALLAELEEIWQRPRLHARIKPEAAQNLLQELRQHSVMTDLTTIPPRCRDPKDHPVLATAIDGQADAIVTADEELRAAMLAYGVELWGIDTLLAKLAEQNAGA